MSEEQLKAFLEKVKGDTSLQDKLKAAADSDAVLAIATEAGFSISTEDLKNDQLEVSDKELEAAAGGGYNPEQEARKVSTPFIKKISGKSRSPFCYNPDNPKLSGF